MISCMATLPKEFLQEIAGYASSELSGLEEALLVEPTTSVRVNAAKGAAVPVGADVVGWCPTGFYLAGRQTFAFDPEWHQGAYYVQDASSMVVDAIVRKLTADGRPVRLLDACAAPGGKTTAAIGAMPEGSVVVANEFVAQRCSVLRENLTKWGYPYVAVTQGAVNRLGVDAPGLFDIVIADVPCSGEGMMRKDVQAVEQWSRGLVEQCAVRQREIVDALWSAVKPGGWMLYSTCTFNRRENEEMVDYIVKNFGAESVDAIDAAAYGIGRGIDTPYHCYRFTPGRVRGEGLFMAVLRKPEISADGPLRKNPQKQKSGQTKRMKIPAEVKQWLTIDADWVEESGEVVAYPKNELSDVLPGYMRPRLVAGIIKGRDVVGTQALALSNVLRREAFAECEVDGAIALNYLCNSALVLDASVPRGQVLLTYKGRPLGFVKNLGSRANNLYPRQWRILAPSPVLTEVLRP